MKTLASVEKLSINFSGSLAIIQDITEHDGCICLPKLQVLQVQFSFRGGSWTGPCIDSIFSSFGSAGKGSIPCEPRHRAAQEVCAPVDH